MSETEKRCGTCRHYDVQGHINGSGECDAPDTDERRPASIFRHFRTSSMFFDEGTTCPAHERRNVPRESP